MSICTVLTNPFTRATFSMISLKSWGKMAGMISMFLLIFVHSFRQLAKFVDSCYLFNIINLRNPPYMALLIGKRCLEPLENSLFNFVLTANKPRADRQHISVIMLARQTQNVVT